MLAAESPRRFYHGPVEGKRQSSAPGLAFETWDTYIEPATELGAYPSSALAFSRQGWEGTNLN